MNYKLTAVLLAVLVMVGGAILITRALGSKTPEEQPAQLYKVSEEDITGLKISHVGTTVEYELLSDQASIAAALGEAAPTTGAEYPPLWVIKDGNNTPVYQPKWSATTLLLSGPRSDRELAKLQDLAQELPSYGLMPPQTEVTITLLGRVELSFELGDPTPDERNWYARLAGSDRLFILSAAWSDAVSKLASEPPYPPTMFAVNVDDLTLVSVSSGGQDKRYDYVLQDDEWVGIQYTSEGLEWITGDEMIPVDASAWADALDLFSDPFISVAQEQDIDVASKYGLDVGQQEVLKTLLEEADGETSTFYLGDTTPDGLYRFAGSATQELLYLVPTEWAEAVTRLITDPPYLPK